MAFPGALRVFGKFAGKALAREAGIIPAETTFKITPDQRADLVQVVAEGMYLAMKQLAEEEADGDQLAPPRQVLDKDFYIQAPSANRGTPV
jgi:hypothetical protein